MKDEQEGEFGSNLGSFRGGKPPKIKLCSPKIKLLNCSAWKVKETLKG